MTHSARPTRRRRRTGGAPVRAVGAVLVATVVTAACLVVSTGDVAAQGCGPAPAGLVAVAVVVDDDQRVSDRCVVVPDRTDGYAVLRAAGHQLRIEAGFLCAIDGFPATGCANRPGFDGAYWRYFHATPGGEWTYSNVGGGGYRMPSRCAIEGWRWAESGGATMPPRTAPPQMTCEAPPPTAAPTVPPPTTPPAPAPTAAAPTGRPGGAAPAASGDAATPPPSPTPDGTPTGDAPVEGAVDPDGPAADATGDAAGGTTTSSPGDAVADEDGSTARDDADERADAGRAVSTQGSGSPVGLVLAVLVVAVLGGGAYWRSRRGAAAATGESVEGP